MPHSKFKKTWGNCVNLFTHHNYSINLTFVLKCKCKWESSTPNFGVCFFSSLLWIFFLVLLVEKWVVSFKVYVILYIVYGEGLSINWIHHTIIKQTSAISYLLMWCQVERTCWSNIDSLFYSWAYRSIHGSWTSLCFFPLLELILSQRITYLGK